MSALFPRDESHKNKSSSFKQRREELKFPTIPLTRLPYRVHCPDEVELEYPCDDKSKDTRDFSSWSYFKEHATDTTKVVSRQSCSGWSPALLKRLREPLRTDREIVALANRGKNKKKPPRPRINRAQVTKHNYLNIVVPGSQWFCHVQHLMEALHPINERGSDISAVSASTVSHVPRPRTPPERISEEELHRWVLHTDELVVFASTIFVGGQHRRFLAKQEAEFQAELSATRSASVDSDLLGPTEIDMGDP